MGQRFSTPFCNNLNSRVRAVTVAFSCLVLFGLVRQAEKHKQALKVRQNFVVLLMYYVIFVRTCHSHGTVTVSYTISNFPSELRTAPRRESLLGPSQVTAVYSMARRE